MPETHTADYHLKLMIGDLMVQLAVLRARVEELESARPVEPRA